MAAETLTREEQIERYVALEAIDGLIGALSAGRTGIFRPAPLVDIAPSHDDVHIEDLGRLLDELWPGGDDLESDEYGRATARATMLTARMLLALVADPAYLTEAASNLLEWQGERFKERSA